MIFFTEDKLTLDRLFSLTCLEKGKINKNFREKLLIGTLYNRIREIEKSEQFLILKSFFILFFKIYTL